MKGISKQQGRVPHPHAGKLQPAKVAQRWPQMPCSVHEREETFNVQELPSGVAARVVLASYRQSAEMYLKDWRGVAVRAIGDHPGVDLVELNVVDNAVRAFLVCRYRSHMHALRWCASMIIAGRAGVQDVASQVAADEVWTIKHSWQRCREQHHTSLLFW